MTRPQTRTANDPHSRPSAGRSRFTVSTTSRVDVPGKARDHSSRKMSRTPHTKDAAAQVVGSAAVERAAAPGARGRWLSHRVAGRRRRLADQQAGVRSVGRRGEFDDEVVGNVGIARPGSPAATVAGVRATGWAVEQLAEVTRLFTAPEVRGAGVGRCLLQRAVEAAHARGRSWTFVMTVAQEHPGSTRRAYGASSAALPAGSPRRSSGSSTAGPGPHRPPEPHADHRSARPSDRLRLSRSAPKRCARDPICPGGWVVGGCPPTGSPMSLCVAHGLCSKAGPRGPARCRCRREVGGRGE